MIFVQILPQSFLQDRNISYNCFIWLLDLLCVTPVKVAGQFDFFLVCILNYRFRAPGPSCKPHLFWLIESDAGAVNSGMHLQSMGRGSTGCPGKSRGI